MNDRMLPRALTRDVWSFLRAREMRPRPTLPDNHTSLRTITADGGQSAEVWIYGEIGFWGITALDVVNQLLAIGSPRLTVRLNSEGGDVFDGIAIYNALMEHPAAVDVEVDGLAASAASLIAMAGQTRTMKSGTQMMIHDAHGMVMGNEADMRAYADLLDRICNEIAAIYAARAGAGTPAEWRAVMRAETWYTAGEAVDAGLATAGPTAQADDPTAPHLVPAARLSHTSFLYAGRASAPPPRRAVAEPAGDPPPSPPPAETATGWAALNLTDIAAAFAATKPPSKEAVR